MKSIPKEQVLRVNCPGFGEENYFTVGKAKTLDAYKAIIVNPVSVFHLFDKDLALQKEIDVKLADGLTSLTIPSDAVLQSIQEDLKSKRILELVSFLEKGGLLIYYLCRPFLVQGDNIAIDNYSWLESLAPDSSPDDNIRHMSAVSHGRIVEQTEHTVESGFSKYFNQSGIEWNTIIRTDFLTEGYTALATAGPRKCIAGQLPAGDQGGKIIFLPAPYSPDFDKVLMECVNIWYNQVDAETAAAPTSPPTPPARTTSTSNPQIDSPRTSTTRAQAITVPPSPRTSTTSAPAIAQPSSPRTSTTNAPPVTPPAAATAAGQERVSSQFTARGQETPSSAATSHTLPAMQQGTLHEPTLSKDPSSSQATAEFDAESVRAFLAGDQPPVPKAAEPSADKPAEAKPSAADILKELEALSMGAPPLAPTTTDSKPAEPAAALKKNLFDDDDEDIMATPPKAEANPAEIKAAAPAPAPASATTAAPAAPPVAATPTEPEEPNVEASKPEPTTEAKGLNAHLNQMAESLAAQAEAKRSEPVKPTAPETEAAQAPEATTPLAPKAEEFAPDTKFESNFQFESDFNFNDLEKELAKRPPKEPEAPPEIRPEVQPESRPASLRENHQENHKEESPSAPPTPEAKDLIKKMEEISKTMASPDWAVDVTFPDVEELKKERLALTESIKQAQSKIASIDNKIAQIEALKAALLGAEGEDLVNASVRVFNRLGWNAAPAGGKNSDEFHLSGGSKTEFIAKVVKSAGQAQRSDLSSLASSVVEFWDRTEIEPKGILVACTWSTRPPSERTEPDFAEGLAEFAQKKGLCLMTTTQLLSMYRDIEMGKQSSDDLRKKIEETNGRLPGFQLLPAAVKV
ncbi:MAG TPA: hypothetical protein V6C86_05160 [Oculatellaceae cyanobacterium]